MQPIITGVVAVALSMAMASCQHDGPDAEPDAPSPPSVSSATARAAPTTTATPPSSDPCSALPDGVHVERANDAIVVSRTCRGGVSTSFCDVELTRAEGPLTPQRCADGVGRSMTFTNNVTSHGKFDLRLGGRVRGIDYAAIDIGGTLTVSDLTTIDPVLSGPFRPDNTDRFAVIRAKAVEGALRPGRIPVRGGGSFDIVFEDGTVVLFDYRP